MYRTPMPDHGPHYATVVSETYRMHRNMGHNVITSVESKGQQEVPQLISSEFEKMNNTQNGSIKRTKHICLLPLPNHKYPVWL